jgi:DNA-3-methyladenine glycosylase II
VPVYTIGHSTRPFDELVSLLRGFDVDLVADIRSIPRSRHNPQYDGATLRAALRSRRLGYAHVPELGGLRRPRRDSPNTGWHNASFRGFADYMLAPEFEAGLEALRRLTARGRVALMCAEAVPWRCHRSLVADALTARGARVEHITGPGRAGAHRMTSFAEVAGDVVTYPRAERLPTRAPFHLEATVRVLQRRPTNLVDVWEDGRFLRVLPTPQGPALFEVRNHGTIDAPNVRLDVLAGEPSTEARGAARRTLRSVLGLDVDPAPLQRTIEDAGLGAVALRLRGMRPPRFAGLFEAFASVIPFQQLSLDSGVAIVRRLVERFGTPLEHEEQRRYAFPTASAVAGAPLGRLEACGLSGAKAEALRSVARRIEAGEVTAEKLEGLGSAEAIRVLTDLPGVGTWTASVLLLRGLGRLDVFPPGDVGVARGLGELLPARRSLERLVRRLGDRRGYLYFCALGAALLGRGLISSEGGRHGESTNAARGGRRRHRAR